MMNFYKGNIVVKPIYSKFKIKHFYELVANRTMLELNSILSKKMIIDLVSKGNQVEFLDKDDNSTVMLVK